MYDESFLKLLASVAGVSRGGGVENKPKKKLEIHVENIDDGVTEISQADLPSALLVEVERRSMNFKAGERRNEV